jgi:hypothetical protein
VADSFTFTGQARTGWFAYTDTATGRMLEADPGGTYSMVPMEPGLAVPPDARWLPAGLPAAKAVAKAAADTKPASAPGGEL